MSEKIADENLVDLSGLELVKKTDDGDLIFAPPTPEPVAPRIPVRDNRVVQGQVIDQPPESPAAEKSHFNRRHAWVIGTVALGLVSGLGWAGHELIQAPSKKAPVTRANAQPPVADSNKNIPSVPTSDPTETIDLTGILVTPEEDSTTQPSVATTSSPIGPQILAPPTTGDKPSPANTTKPSPAASSASSAPSRAATSPESTTPVVPPSAAETSAPISTEKIKPRELATHPSVGAVEVLRSFVRSGDVTYYSNEYSNLSENLDLEQLARDGNLKKLTVSSIRDHQRNLRAEYANDAVAGILGEPAWLSEARLREMRSSGQNASDRLLEFTDNLLEKAPAVYPVTGKSIAEVPYLNDELSDELTEQLHTGVDPSVGEAEDTHLLAVKTAEIKGDSTVALAAVIGTYHKDGAAVNTFRWDLLEPINNLGAFVGVTVFEKELNTVPPATSESTPTTEEPEPTATATDASYASDENNGHRNNKARHHGKHHRGQE